MNSVFVIDKTTKCNLGLIDFIPRKDDRISMKASEWGEIEVVVECVLYEPLEHATLVFVSVVKLYYTAMVNEIKGKIKSMKEYVNVKELLEEVDAMAKRGTLLARGGVTQEDLAMQIRGLICHVAMKEEEKNENNIIEDNAKTIKKWLKHLDFEHEHPGYGKDVYKKLDEIIYEEMQRAAHGGQDIHNIER